jgi:hypothetical protein
MISPVVLFWPGTSRLCVRILHEDLALWSFSSSLILLFSHYSNNTASIMYFSDPMCCKTPGSLAESISNINSDLAGVRRLCALGYTIQHVSWEDVGRTNDSCWGPNITDQTLTVQDPETSQQVQMPVIRKPNFADETCDVPIDNFRVTIGNETGSTLRQLSLKAYLEQHGWYRSRDESILVSTQTCILPLTNGFCNFGVKLFNNQTREDDPSLAVIVSSAQGTSTVPITTQDQTLYFNRNGKAHPFEACRLEQDRLERKVDAMSNLELTIEEKQRNVLLMFHVPLKQKSPRPFVPLYPKPDQLLAAACSSTNSSGWARGFDAAMLRVGATDAGAFPSLDPNEVYERDERFPIRCVIQNYAVTDVPELSNEVLEYVCSRLKAPLEVATAHGSLVVATGDRERITASRYNIPNPIGDFVLLANV